MKYITLVFAALAMQTISLQALQLNKPRSKQSAQIAQLLPIISPQQQHLNDTLYDASIEGEIDKVLELIELHASPNATCPVASEWNPNALRGATALISAANRGNFEMCQTLILSKATPEIRDHRGHNALLHAGLKKNREIFFLLLANTQADTKSFDDLHLIDEFIKKYRDKESHELESLTKYFDSVCLKCMREKTHFISTFLRSDATGMHLLHYGASWSSPEVCRELIQTLRLKEITLNPKTKKEKTPLHLIPVGSERNCRLLLENGADINALAMREKKEGYRRPRNGDMQSPLEHALEWDKNSIAELLIEFGAVSDPDLFPKAKHHLLKKVIYTSDKASRSKSKKIIITFLLCCKRYCPRLPRDIRHMLLDLISWTDLGRCMVDRKLDGLSIPAVFLKQAETALYDETLEWLKMHGLTPTYIEQQMSEGMRENIKKRLAKEKLLCNGE
jgi:ankyrin repeat protein